MAKVHSTSIPDLLKPLFYALTSPGKVISGPDGTLRLKKGKKAPKKEPKPDPDLVAWTRIAEIVATKEGYTLGEGDTEYFIFSLVRELVAGVVNPAYFRKCKIESAKTLESICTSSPDPDPPPYGFRTELFMPTVPVYPNGTETTETRGFAGQKVGLFFEDTFLRWRKIKYKSKNINAPDLLDRVLMKWDVTVTASTSARGSRPMFSLNIFGVWARAGAAEFTTNEPPIMKRTLLYWRFKIPASAPPYYNASQVRRIMKPFKRIAKKQGTGMPLNLFLNAANRPMMGRGFNNNNTVFTSFNTDPELWEVKMCTPDIVENWEPQTTTAQSFNARAIWSPPLRMFLSGWSNTTPTHPHKSEDGTTWTPIPALSAYQWVDGCWSPERAEFCCILRQGVQHYSATSPDGERWTFSPYSEFTQVSHIAWSAPHSRYVSFGLLDNNYVAWHASNGLTWSLSPTPNMGWIFSSDVSPTQGRIVAVVNQFGTSEAWWSDDAVNWHSTTGMFDQTWKAVAWSPKNSRWVAVSGSNPGGTIAYSADGKTWNMILSPANTLLFDVRWIAELEYFIAVGANISGECIYTSPEGWYWTPRTTPIMEYIYSLSWCPDLCLLLASGSKLSTPTLLAAV